MITDMSASVASPPLAVSLPVRVIRLFAGLVLFGLGLALMVRADLGLGPWDVLHQGLGRLFDVPIGTVTIGVGAVVLLAWIPLRQRPGFGTVANVIVVGLAVDVFLAALPTPHRIAVRLVLLALGIVLTAAATGLYVGASLGPGPRDGLMTGLAKRGVPIRVGRTAVELVVLGAGWLAGGSVGLGTVLFAATIGPLVHYALPRLTVTSGKGAGRE